MAKQWNNIPDKNYIAELASKTDLKKEAIAGKVKLFVEGGVPGGNVNVVQTTGTSTKDVMSQDATTSMVYADPNNKTRVQIGNSTSNNLNSISIGNNISADGTRAIAIGDKTDDTVVTADGASAISIGVNTSVSSDSGNGIAIGVRAKTTGAGAIALGTYSTAGGQYSFAMHYQAEASGNFSTAMGTSSKATGTDSTAIGQKANAGANRAVSLGYNAQATKASSIALGGISSATGVISTAVGASASASGDYSVALGYGSSATARGQMDVGALNGYGYNNTNYRLLTGIHEPVNNHDAANKEYVDSNSLTYINLTPTSFSETEIAVTSDKTIAEINALVSAGTPIVFKLVLSGSGIGDFLPGTYFLQPTFIGSSGVIGSAASYNGRAWYEYRWLSSETSGTISLGTL